MAEDVKRLRSTSILGPLEHGGGNCATGNAVFQFFKEVWPETIAYHAERLHEGRLVPVDVPQLTVPRCAHCAELVFNYSAEEQILKAIQLQERGSSALPSG